MDKNIRQISNTKNCVLIVFGFILITICVIEILFIIITEKHSWPSRMEDLVFLLVGIIGILLFLWGLLNFFNVKSDNKYLKNLDYGFDYQKELSTYCIIGINKKVKNGALKFNKYSEWKNYLEKEYNNIINNEDAYHFFIRRLRNKKSYIELLVAVLVPIEISLLATFYAASSDLSVSGKTVALFITAIIFVIIMTIEFNNCKEEINFLNDIIEIVFPNFQVNCKNQ